MWRSALLAVVLASMAGCRAYNSNNPYPSKQPATGNDFPIVKGVINNNVERGSPNLE